MLTPDEYNVGDRVRVVIEGEITYVGGSGVLPGIAVLAGEWGTAIPLGVPGVTVERLAPPEPEVPEWWERRGPGMSVLENGTPWLRLGDVLQFPWVAPPNLGRTDAQMLEQLDGPLVLLYDPTAPGLGGGLC